MFAAVDAWRAARAARAGYVLREYNRPIVYVLLALVGLFYPVGMVFALRATVFEAFVIPAASMVPNILDGDRILVNKLALQARLPERGDVIVFRNPKNRQLNFVKRVIALPGDKVAVRENVVLVNGRRLEWERVPPSSLEAVRNQANGDVFDETNAGRRYRIMLGGGSPAPDFAETTVPEGTLFVLGDNRDNSIDSRQFGFVPLGELLGYVQYVYLPAESWTRFGPYRDKQ
jgi:signal peptidase I